MILDKYHMHNKLGATRQTIVMALKEVLDVDKAPGSLANDPGALPVQF